MRTFIKAVSVLSVGLFVAAAACNGDNTQTDAGPDTGIVKKDSGTKDVSTVDVPVVCTAASSYSTVTNETATFTPTPTDGGTADASAADGSADASADADDGSADATADDGSAEASTDASADAGFGGGAQDSYVYNGDLNANPDVLSLELYTGFGIFTNGIKTGTFNLTGQELNYATCGLCVLVYVNASSSAPDPYMATGGTVTITSLQPTLTGTLSNVTFTHVTIDQNSFQSTPVGDGCSSSIASVSISAPVTVK